MREEPLARAREFVPVLRERARRAEEQRRIPDETVEEFREAGFYRIFQPARYGGHELDYGVQVEMAAELGRGCASSAWDASVTACHAWILGMFPAEAQDDVWGDDPTVELSTSFMPIEPRIRRVDGGLRVSGRWRFSSGVGHCGWAIAIVPVPPAEGDGPPERGFALLPLDACRIDDVWFVAGLAGTGSNDVLAEDVFVPDHRWVAAAELAGGVAPGGAVNPGYLYRLPLLPVFPYNIVGPGIGAARGALDSVIESVKRRRSAVTGANVAEQQSAHLRVAEASVEIDLALRLVLDNADEFNAVVKAGGQPDVDQRLRYRRDTAYAATLSVRAVERLFPLLGGQGLSLEHDVQRAWRDVHAVAQHIGLTWDVHGAAYGAVALGNPPDPRV